MHPIRRIEEIGSTLGQDEDGAAEIRGAMRILEAGVAVGEILAAVADERFPETLIDVSRGCEEADERAWLTFAAAGQRRTCQVLAWRASQVVDAGELARLTVMRRRARARRLAQLASTAGDRASAAAWGLLAHLSGDELRAMVRARPALATAQRRADAGGARTPMPVPGAALA